MVGTSAGRNVLFNPALAPAATAGARPRYLHRVRVGRLDPYHGDTVGDCALDDLRGAADAGRHRAVPDRDQYVDIRQHKKTRRLIGAGALIGSAVKLEHIAGADEQRFELATRHFRLEVTLVLGPGERQDGLQGKAGRKPRFRDDAVRAFGERRDDDEFGRGIRLARRCGDCGQDAIDVRAQRRFGLFRQFRRYPMAADADAQAGRGRRDGQGSRQGATHILRLALVWARPSIAQNFHRGSGHYDGGDVIVGRATKPSSRRPSASVASRNGITK